MSTALTHRVGGKIASSGTISPQTNPTFDDRTTRFPLTDATIANPLAAIAMMSRRSGRTAEGLRPANEMHRNVFISSPPHGDYILSPSGFTWHVRRATGTGSGLSISVGDRSRERALGRLLSLAETDRADAWETDGAGSFRLVKRFRSSQASFLFFPQEL